MVHLVDTSTESGSDAVFQSMFAARKRVFIDLLKWDLPVLAGRYEVDAFDNEHARYLILTDSEHNHLASARLLPTIRPHILGDIFPSLCASPPPRGPGIWEITRFLLDRSLRAAERRILRNHLVTAIAEHALRSGIRKYTGVAEMAWLQQILSFGWECRPLGLPLFHGHSTLGALEIDITPETPALLDANGIWCPTPFPEIPARRAASA